MKLAKEAEIKLDDDPKSIRDIAIWNRLKLMVEAEIVDPAWCCPLYKLHRIGFINSDQREAGDKYQALVTSYRRLMATDPDEYPDYARELAYKRIEKAKDGYRDVIGILGIGRQVVDEVVLEELHWGCEKEKHILRDALQLLANYFNIGNKR